MDILFREFPRIFARERARTLDRFAKELNDTVQARWTSWADVATYSCKRLDVLKRRSTHVSERLHPFEGWFLTARKSVGEIRKIAHVYPWKRTVDICIRRFKESEYGEAMNQLWMATAYVETSRLAKQSGCSKSILPGWEQCFTRNRFRIVYDVRKTDPLSAWDLSAWRNTKLRFGRGAKSCNTFNRRVQPSLIH